MTTRNSKRPILGAFFFAAGFLAFAVTTHAASDVTVQNTTYTNGQVATETATNAITASTSVTVSSGAIVSYVAGTKITLSPGFTASSGSTFRAAIDSDGDGMPDWWEAEHGVSSPTANADSDGLNNLTEFLLGTDPNTTTTASGSIDVNIHRPSE